jgi:putative transcriptional regulator
MSSLQGYLLIASPNESNPDFTKTVILLIQHSEQQAVGVVLNRPTERTIGEIYRQTCHSNQFLYAGGPVPGTLMAVHTCELLAEIEIIPGLYYAVKARNLKKLVREPGHCLKVFDGHAGWGPGQLAEQIEDGGWKVIPGSVEHVFYDGNDLWERLAIGS